MAKSSFFSGSGVSTNYIRDLESITEETAALKDAAAASALASATTADDITEAANIAASNASSAQLSAASAANSQSDAADSASQALSSQTLAASSESVVAANATAAAASEANAATSAANAATKATEASNSQIAAAASEVASEVSEGFAATSAATAATRASEASTSASAALTSANASSTSAAASEASSVASTTKASEAATSATNTAADRVQTGLDAAATAADRVQTGLDVVATAASASSASASADAALAALDNFDDRYLGQKASDPTLDNDGNPLIAGALYFSTTDNVMKVYDGSVWVAAYASLSGVMLSVNNLSDVADVATSRTNLGLATVAATGAYTDLSGTPVLGTAAATAATDYATAAQGALADTALQDITGESIQNLSDVATMTPADGQALVYDTVNGWQAEDMAGGIAYTKQTAAYTIAANEGVIADTSAGSWTLTLPATPLAGDTVMVVDGADWSINNLTVARNGSTIEGDAEDMVMNIGGAAVQFTYDGTTWQTYVQVGALAGLGTTRVNFVATEGQTVFSVTYSAGFVDVYLNGIKLIVGTDFTATNGTTVVLTAGATAGDTIDTVAYDVFSVADTYSVAGADATFVNVTGDTMTGDLVVTGNVGIGTTSPEESLTVAGGAIQLKGNTYTDFSDYWGSGDNTAIFTPYGYLGSNGSFAVSLFSNGYRNSGGGFTSMGNGGLSTASGIELAPSGVIQFRTGTPSGTSVPERIRIDSSGSLLLGTTDTSQWNNTSGSGIVLSSTGRIESSVTNGDTMRLNRIGSNGGIVYFYKTGVNVGSIIVTSSSTSYNTSSDYRLKTDAQPMTGASARVQALKPVNFEWIVDGTRVDGFLAHEAQEVVPEAVTGEKDAMRDEEYEVTPAVLDDDDNVVTEAVMGTRSVPNHQGIDQSKLVPLLTAALQEALTKIEAMEARLVALESV